MIYRVAIALLLMAPSAWADIDRAGNAMDDGGGGSLTFGAVILIALFFGGIVWFMTRFKNDQDGFLWLMGAVFALMVVSGIANCSG